MTLYCFCEVYKSIMGLSRLLTFGQLLGYERV
jgi:hypothetical protein